MKSFSTRKGIMSLEGLEVEATPPESNEPVGRMEAHDPEEVVANELADMTEATTEGDVLEETTAEALEITETLGGIEGAMTDANETGEGVSAPVAEALSAAVEHFKNRMAFPPGKAFPALENFGGKMSRKAATSRALEGIADTLRNAWAAIIKAIKAAVQWVKDFFAKFKFAAKKLADRADALNKKARTADIKEGKIEGGKAKSLFPALSSEGKIPEGKTFASTLTGYLDENGKELKTLYAGAKNINDNVGILTHRLSSTSSSTNEAHDKTNDMIASLSDSLLKSAERYTSPMHEDTPPPKNCRRLTRKLPFGNVANFVVVPRTNIEEAEQLDAIAAFKMYIAPDGTEVSSVPENVEINRLPSSEIQSVTEKIARNMRENLGNEQAVKALEDSSATMEKIAKFVASEKEQNEHMRYLTKLAGVMSKLIQSYAGGFVTNNLKYEANVCKHTLDYCEASLA